MLWALTHIVDDEALALPEDEPGWIWVEGDSQIRGGGGELEGAASPDVPSQNTSRDLIAVSDGQHVTITDVQSEGKKRGKWKASETEVQPVVSPQDK